MGDSHVRLAVANRKASSSRSAGRRRAASAVLAARPGVPGARRSRGRPLRGRGDRRPARPKARWPLRATRCPDTGGWRHWCRARCRRGALARPSSTRWRARYREADFLRCLNRIDHTLDPEHLLQLGHRAEAARAGTLAAACALGAGDEARARDLLRRLSARELVEPGMACAVRRRPSSASPTRSGRRRSGGAGSPSTCAASRTARQSTSTASSAAPRRPAAFTCCGASTSWWRRSSATARAR